MGIYPMDVRARNYKGGRIFDFSAAITEPHFQFAINDPWRIEDDHKRVDLQMFDEMIEKEGIEGAPSAVDNEEFSRKLRALDKHGRTVKIINLHNLSGGETPKSMHVNRLCWQLKGL